MTRDPDVVLGLPVKSEPMVSFLSFTVSFCTCKLEVEVFVISNEVIVALDAEAFRILAEELMKILPVLRLLLCTVPRILRPEMFALDDVIFVVNRLVDVKDVVTVFLELRRDET